MISRKRTFPALVSAAACLLGMTIPLAAQNYPLTAGAQWTLHLRQELGPGVHFATEDQALVKDNVLEAKVVAHVAGTDKIGGADFTRIESLRNNKLWLEEWLRLTPQGLLLAKSVDHSSGEEVSMLPPQQLLSSTLRPGETWNWKQSAGPVSSHTAVGDAEQVTVPAGAFSATPVRVEMTFVTEGQPLVIQQTRWFAAGVGFVKQDTRATIAGHMLFHTVLTLERFELTNRQ